MRLMIVVSYKYHNYVYFKSVCGKHHSYVVVIVVMDGISSHDAIFVGDLSLGNILEKTGFPS